MRARSSQQQASPSLLALATASAEPAPDRRAAGSQATTITVWLMDDAQSNWPEAVAAANAAFKAQSPRRRRQGRVPELGRPQDEVRGDARRQQRARRDRVRQHRHAEVHGGRSARAADQVGLPELGHVAVGARQVGHLQRQARSRVPYYAGARGVIYRTDQYKAAGISEDADDARRVRDGRQQADGEVRRSRTRPTRPSTSRAATGTPRCRSSTTSAARSPRRKGGKWVGTLDSPQALAGLNAWRTMALKLSRANKTGDEAHPQQALVFAKGKVGSFIGNGWEWPYSLDPKLGNPANWPARSAPIRCRATSRASTCRRSSAARSSPIPVTSKEKTLAADWIAAFTSTPNDDDDGRQGRRHPEHDLARARINASKPHARPVRRGGQVELVRARHAELGERRERERAPDDAQRDPPQPRQDAGAGEAGERAHHADPERTRKPTPRERDRSTSQPSRSSRPPGRLVVGPGGVRVRPRGWRRTCSCSPGARRDRGRARLPALPARRALLPAVRPLRADRARGHVDRRRQLLARSSTTAQFWRVLGAHGRLHRGQRRR